MAAEPVQLSEEQRRTARAMAGLGVSRRHVALHLRIEEAALEAMLGEELELAEVEANSKVAKALFTMATQKNNVAAAIFWMKARSGWRERHEVDASVRAEMRAIHVVTGVPREEEGEAGARLETRVNAPGRPSYVITAPQRLSHQP